MNIASHTEYIGALDQLRDPDRRAWILMMPGSIGDTLAVYALAQAFVGQHGHGLRMVATEEHATLAQMFPQQAMHIQPAHRGYIEQLMNRFIEPDRFEVDVPFCAHPEYLGDCRSDEIKYLFKLPGRGGLNMTDAFRYILRLPWNARLNRPIVLDAWEQEALLFADSVGLEIGSSVLLFPTADAVRPQLPEIFWETLAQRLTARGQRVFTCVAMDGAVKPDAAPIGGTIPIKIPLHLLLPMGRMAGRIIDAGASGTQFLQLLGGGFRQMTSVMPIATDFSDFKKGDRDCSPTDYMAQFMYPELCLNRPFEEFLVPFDAPDAELQRLAMAIADEAFDEPNCFRRMGDNGGPYGEENKEWLGALIAPVHY
jgi:hypothetical protein